MTKIEMALLKSKTPVPRYLTFLPLFVALGYISLALVLPRYFNESYLIVWGCGLLLTPVMIYSTIGEVNELVGFAGKKARRIGDSLIKVLPTTVTKSVHTKSLTLLLAAVIVPVIEFALHPIVWFSLVIVMTLLLFIKIKTGFNGHYRYGQLYKNEYSKPIPLLCS